MPKRIQRRRTKGWRMPPNTRCVTRPGRWANPLIGERAGAWFRVWLHNPKSTLSEVLFCAEARGCTLRIHPSYEQWRWKKAEEYLDGIDTLRGQDVACWCGPDDECHGDAVLEFANKSE